ncbi:MAG: hypothetical protein QOE59_5283 [Actinomycetota bacterium]|nr:hypothetical protein [Actinomycetota bacterium]
MIPAALASPVATLAVVVTQAQPPAPGSDRGEEFGKTSPIALVVILLLALATAVLIRSMTKRLRNVPESFDPPEETPPASDTPGTPGTTAASGEAGPAPDRSPPDG